jgi:hypothetical protein
MLLVAILACANGPEDEPGLTVAEVTSLVRPDVEDRRGWAVDVRAALVEAGRVPDADHICQVLAIVEQESGYDPDPAVPGLAAIVERRLQDELAPLGPLAGYARRELLGAVGPGGSGTFDERLAEVETEQELDRLFRELVAFHEGRAPGAVGKGVRFLLPRLEERLNPIDTAGSMQVSVAYAQAHGEADGLSPATVRDLLYTRRGGLRYGTARLFSYEADYPRPLYRFADFNAGPYASRNAAFQEQVADLVGLDLALDGDLTVWTSRGRPADHDGETLQAVLAWRAANAPDLSERRVRADLRREKERAFEESDTWRRVRQSWREANGEEPVYARVPDIALDSPKLQGDLTTGWFASRVQQRYDACLTRGDGG